MSLAAVNPMAPSGKTPTAGMLLLLSVTALSALVIGWLYHFIGRLGDLLIIGPMIAGGLVAFPIRRSARPARCRNPRLVIALGIGSALLMMFCRLYFDSLDMYNTDLPEDLAKQENISLDQARQRVDQVRQQMGSIGAFTTFVEMQADNGMVVESSGSSYRHNSPITGGGFYFMLGLSVLFAALIAGAVCNGTYSPGYCERCGAWFGTEQLGMGEVIAAEALVAAVGRHDWPACRKLQRPVVGQPKGVSYLLTLLHTCAQCGEGYLQVTAHVTDKSRTQNVLLRVEPLSAAEVASAIQSVC